MYRLTTDSERLSFLERKVYDLIYWSRERNLWVVKNTNDSFISGSSTFLRKAIDQSMFMEAPECLWEYNDGNDGLRLDFLSKKIFNAIRYNKVIGSWLICDYDTGMPVSMDFSLRKCIDKFLCY